MRPCWPCSAHTLSLYMRIPSKGVRNVGIYTARGDYAMALRYLEKSLALSRAVSDRAGEGAILNNIGQIYHRRGDYAMALRYLEKSLALSRAVSDRAGEGAILDNIGQFIARAGITRRRCGIWKRRWPSAAPSAAWREGLPSAILG